MTRPSISSYSHDHGERTQNCFGHPDQAKRARTSRGRAARTLAPRRGAERAAAPSAVFLGSAESARGGARGAAAIRSPASGWSAAGGGAPRRAKLACVFVVIKKMLDLFARFFRGGEAGGKRWGRRTQSSRGWRAGPLDTWLVGGVTDRWGWVRERPSRRRVWSVGGQKC